MTFILIASFFLIAFVALLRYDVHKHKYTDPKKNNSDTSSGSDSSHPSSNTSKDKQDESGSDGDGGN